MPHVLTIHQSHAGSCPFMLMHNRLALPNSSIIVRAQRKKNTHTHSSYHCCRFHHFISLNPQYMLQHHTTNDNRSSPRFKPRWKTSADHHNQHRGMRGGKNRTRMHQEPSGIRSTGVSLALTTFFNSPWLDLQLCTQNKSILTLPLCQSQRKRKSHQSSSSAKLAN